MGIPPDFRNSVVGTGGPTALLCHLVEGGLQKMALDIFPGIKGFREAFNFIVHGAGNLQVCTAAMEEKGSGGVGVKLIQELKGDLQDYLDRKGYSSIMEIRGIARDRVVEHAQVRRKSDNYNGGYSMAS